MTDVVDRVDAFQRRHRVIGLPLAVIYKFFDDQGNNLAAIITYYTFIAIFPMMLIASSVLGFVLQGNEELKNQVLDSALSQFPIVGSQLGKPEGLQGSTSAIVFGGLAALYGVVGFGNAAQNAVSVVQAIPRNVRLNPIISRLRSIWLVGIAGLTLVLVTVLSSAASHIEVFGFDVGNELTWVLKLGSLVLTTLVLGVIITFASSHRPRFRQVLPGAFFVAVTWQLLQELGGLYVKHVIGKTDEIGSVFALVLGLIALIYIASTLGVFGLEINVVLAKHLYPRALLTPFTDAVQLTDADRRVYTEYAQAQRHKGFQRVHVAFDDED